MEVFVNNAEGVDLDDSLLQRNSKSALNLFECTLMMINAITGMGALKLSVNFKYGAVSTSIVNLLLCLVSYYANWMLLTVMKIKRTFSYEESWRATMKHASFLTSINIIIPSVSFTSWYFLNIQELLISLLQQYYPNSSYIFKDTYLIAISVAIIICLPVIFQRTMKLVSVLSMIAFLCCIFAMVHITYWFIKYYNMYGFDPDQKMVLYSSNGIVAVFSDYISAYCGFMFTFPCLSQLKSLTFNRGKSLMKYTHVFLFIFYEYTGLVSYFTLWDKQGSAIIYDKLPQGNMFLTIAYIVYIVLILCSIPMMINPARESALQIVSTTTKYPSYIWTSSGVLVAVTSILWTSLTGTYLSILRLFMSAAVMIIGFILPALMLSKVMDKLSKIHWVGITFFLVVGIGTMLFSLISPFL